MALNCVRYLGFRRFEDIDRLTLPEYRLLMKAVRLRQVDLDYRNHLQAFLNFAVQAKKKTGKCKERPVYSKFKKFYDYSAELNRALGREKAPGRFSRLSKYLAERRNQVNGE